MTLNAEAVDDSSSFPDSSSHNGESGVDPVTEFLKRISDTHPAGPLDSLTRFIGPETFVMEGIPLEAIETTAVILPELSGGASPVSNCTIISAVPEKRLVTRVPNLPPDVVIEMLRTFGTTGDPGILTRATISQAFARPMISVTDGGKVSFYFDTFTVLFDEHDVLHKLFALKSDEKISPERLDLIIDEKTQLPVLILDEGLFFRDKDKHLEEGLIYPKILYTGPFERDPRIAVQAGFKDIPMANPQFVRDFLYFTAGLRRQLDQLAVALENRTLVRPDQHILDVMNIAQRLIMQDLKNRLTGAKGFSQLLQVDRIPDEVRLFSQNINQALTLGEYLAVYLDRLLHRRPVMQLVDLRGELQGVGTLLPSLLNREDDHGNPLSTITFDVANDKPLVTRAVPDVYATLIYLLINSSVVDHGATRANVAVSAEQGSIVFRISSNMRRDQVYPSDYALPANIQLLLYIFAARFSIHESSAESGQVETTVDIRVPVVN